MCTLNLLSSPITLEQEGALSGFAGALDGFSKV